MNLQNNDMLHSLEWRPARYYGKRIGAWFVSETGVLYNPETDEVRYGRDNVKGKDKHQRISIKNKSYYISRIVAEAFVPNDNPTVNIIVRHLNDDPLNNHYSNLKWGTSHENTLDAIRNGKIKYDENRKYTIGENHPGAVLKNDDVNIIIELLNNSVPLVDISERFNVDVDVVRHIYKGTSWRSLTHKHLPFPKQVTHNKPMDVDVKNNIIQLLTENPNAMPMDIIKTLNIEYSNTNRSYIGKIKRKMKQKL